jgi:hypothetical protein
MDGILNHFVLTENSGKLYGRGSSDDKGPVLCWLHAVEAYQTEQRIAYREYLDRTRADLSDHFLTPENARFRI